MYNNFINELYFGRKEEFEVTTPEGNVIRGYISKEHDFKLGSLLIKKINGKEDVQFIQGYPKMTYMEKPINSYNRFFVLNKNDGTNIEYYPLKRRGKIIEIVPKTRGVPVAEGKFLDFAMRIKQAFDFVFDTEYTLTIEMYGYELAKYFEYGIDYKVLNIPFDFRAISLFGDGNFEPYFNLKKNVEKYGIKPPLEQFNIRKNVAGVVEEFERMYFRYLTRRLINFEDMFNLYKKCQIFYEDVNNNYRRIENKKDGLIIEGSVWVIERGDEELYFKNKGLSEIESKNIISNSEIRRCFRRSLEDLSIKEFLDSEACIKEFITHVSEDHPKEEVEKLVRSGVITKEYNHFIKRAQLVDI